MEKIIIFKSGHNSKSQSKDQIYDDFCIYNTVIEQHFCIYNVVKQNSDVVQKEKSWKNALQPAILHLYTLSV